MKNPYSFHMGKVVPGFFRQGGDVTFSGIEEEYLSEQEHRKGRRKKFEELFPRLDKTPFLRGIAKGIYSHGAVNVISVIAILMIFTAIKAPYFGLPFTGEHSTKYNTYVEPALYMAQNNNPLLYQKKYVADPITNPEGIFQKFDSLPLFEWGLFATYKIIPYGSIETKTRLYTHFIGLWILVFAYLFFVHWLPEKLTLLVLAMMSVNPIIVFGTYVTVLDSLAILCMFLSFVLLNRHSEEGDFTWLFWAGITYGIGNSVKYSLFLWMAPISFLLIYYRNDRVAAFLRDFLIYTMLGILVILTYKTSIGKMIGSPILSAGFLVAWILFYGALYILLKRRQSNILLFIDKIYRNKIFLFVFLLSIILLGSAAILFFKFGDYGEEYLTDLSILFNYRLYKYMLFHQFKNYMTRNIFWLGMAGFLLVFALGNPRSKRLVSSFLLGSAAYWVIASKAMFFHNYYTLILMILFSMTASFLMYYMYRNMPTIGAKAILVLLLSALILPPAKDATDSRLEQYDRVADVITFVKENTGENDFILYEGWLSPLVIYTGRGFVKPATLISDRIREEIQKYGFAETMAKYRIKYFFSPYEKPFYEDFAPLFANTNIIEPGGKTFNRSITIFEVLGQKYPNIHDDLQEIKDIVNNRDLPGKFKLVAKIGKYNFYSFLN